MSLVLTPIFMFVRSKTGRYTIILELWFYVLFLLWKINGFISNYDYVVLRLTIQSVIIRSTSMYIQSESVAQGNCMN